MSLENYLLRPDDGRQEVFSQWTDNIRRCDRIGPAARVAGYWALVEWYVDRFANGDEMILRFERIVEEGSKYLNDQLDGVPGFSISEEALAVESKTSEKRPQNQRIFGWREKLNSEEIEEVETVVRMFGMEDALWD
jgi:hypothetical protein